MVRLGVLLAVACVAVPLVPAQAQTEAYVWAKLALDSVQMPASPLDPDGLAQTMKVHWAYTLSEGAAAIASAGAVRFDHTILHFQPVANCAGSGVLVTGASDIPIGWSPPPVGAPPQTQVQADAIFHIQATSDAPGETPIKCTFTAYVDAWGANNEIPATAPATLLGTVEVAYHGLIDVTAPVTVAQAGPQKTISYAIHVTNLGNSRTFVEFRVVDSHVADGWNAVAPREIVLESKNQGGTTTSSMVDFVVATPYHEGSNVGQQIFQLTVSAQSTKDPALVGNERTVNVLAMVRDCYSEDASAAGQCAAKSPSAGIEFAFGLVACAFVASRRR
ncbi:MAG: hypothetical protein V4510_11295 [bacterium]